MDALGNQRYAGKDQPPNRKGLIVAARETVRLVVPTQPQAVAQTRDALRALVIHWKADHLADDLLLCLSEALTNAITHAVHGTTVTVDVARNETGIRVEVADRDRRAPVFAVPAEAVLADHQLADRLLEEHGRGLFLMDAVSSRWGISPDPHGKVVWFEKDFAD